MENVPQYQRAVTPVMEVNNHATRNTKSSTILSTSSVKSGGVSTIRNNDSIGVSNRNNGLSNLARGLPRLPSTVNSHSVNNDLTINIQGKSATVSSSLSARGGYKSANDNTDLNKNDTNNSNLNSLSRYDLIPITDENPQDGIVFAKFKSHSDVLVVFRTPEERLRNPERLNLDRRHLDACPLLEHEQRLRLLNYQNNNIRVIQNIENLPNLIFLDLYNNKLSTLDGPLSSAKGLRVLMAGKNRIGNISNLSTLRKLDVLDLHSNDIKVIEGLEGLGDLRVLNLAGNRISIVQNITSLQSLTELNLRRNNIDKVHELDKLPSLQRIFLSHNVISNYHDISCLFNIKLLVELSLDGNPISDVDPLGYRNKLIANITSLKHLDLKKISDEERLLAIREITMSLSIHNNNTNNTNNDNENQSINEISMPIQQGYATDGAITNDITDPKKWKIADSLSQGMISLARSGKLSSLTQSMFDLEVIGPTEKALIIVGENWEWVQTRRLLTTVIEASLYHIKKGPIISKFAINISWLPGLKNFKLVNNEIETLKDLYSIIEALQVYGCPTLEHFVIRDNIVCSSTCILLQIVTAAIPSLKYFNDIGISDQFKCNEAVKYKPIIKVFSKVNKIIKNNSKVKKPYTIPSKSTASSIQQGIENLCNEMVNDVISKRNCKQEFYSSLNIVFNSIVKDTVHCIVNNNY